MKKYKKPIFEKLDKEVINKYCALKKEGYYLRQNVFDNTTIYVLCLDKGNGQRSVNCEVNKQTAKFLSKHWGFKISDPVLYFGKETPISNWEVRFFVATQTETILD